MGDTILPQSVASGAGPQVGMRLVQGSPWDRRRSPLFRLGPTLKVPLSLAFLFPQKGMPLSVGPWTRQSLFGFRAMPLACWFLSIPLESKVEWAVVWKSWFWNSCPFSPLLSPSSKTKENKTILTEFVILSQIWANIGHYIRTALPAFQKPFQCLPVLDYFHLIERGTKVK